MLLLRSLKTTFPLKKLSYAFTQVDWEHIPKLWNLKNTKAEKRILYGKDGFLPKYITDLNDTLKLPGVGSDRLFILYQ